MSYFDKYLKYKKKYLDLKSMLGGEAKREFTYEYITNNLWNAVDEKNGDPIYPKYIVGKELEPFDQYFNEYCWIPPKKSNYNYGQGFFLYTIKPEAKQSLEDFNNNNELEIFNKPTEGKLNKELYKWAPDYYAIFRPNPITSQITNKPNTN
jgi:hypothetical protein